MKNREINQLIEERLKLLASSNQTSEDLFKIIHRDEEMIFCEQTDGYRIKQTTYGECKFDALKMGTYLALKLEDLDKHTYVGLMMENKLEFITVFFGLLMAGYIPVLLNIRLGTTLNDEIVERLNLKWIVSDADYNLRCQKIIINDFDYASQSINEDLFDWENHLAISTSATSQNIKVCIYDGKAICEQIKNTKWICKSNYLAKSHVNGYLKQLAFLPFYHIFGLMATYFWFAFFGRCFVFLKDYSNDTIIKTIKKHQVTHIFAVPLFWHTVSKGIIKEVAKQDEKTKKRFYQAICFSNNLQSVFPKIGLFFAEKAFKAVRNKVFGDSVKFMISGGSYLSEDTSTIINGIGYPLFNGYGMSEIGITSVELSLKASERIKNSIGDSFENVSYKISSNGCLLVKSNGICQTIITKDEIIKVDNEQYFNTCDLVKCGKDNKFYILGRSDDVIITDNGEKINPDVVEKVIKFNYIDRYSLLGIKQNDKMITALVLEIKPNLSQVRINQIIDEVEKMVDKLIKINFVIDQIYYTNDAICLPEAIKVSRKILIKLIEKNKVKLIPFNEFKNHLQVDLSILEQQIAEEIKLIVAEILNLNMVDIDITSHFIFDLGGTSLDYLTLLIKLEDRYEIDFNNKQEYCYTILAFTKEIIKNS